MKPGRESLPWKIMLAHGFLGFGVLSEYFYLGAVHKRLKSHSWHPMPRKS